MDKNQVQGAIGLIIIITILFLHQKCRDDELKNNGLYSIATVTGFTFPDGMGTYCEYTFKYNNRDINKENALDCYKNIQIGDRFYVRFSKNYAQILYDKPVPDSISSVPIEGWYDIPPIDSTKIPIKNCWK